MSDSKVRVRFAPSPTGRLHIGNVRTGLFNYLYARRTGGTLVLRIEDTDVARGSEEFERSIFDGLAWLGIPPDEGPEQGGSHGPYRQSERTEQYQKHLHQLIDQALAYPCYCTPEELEAEREAQRARGEAPRYSGRCRELSTQEQADREAAGLKPVFRFRIPEGESVEFDDLIRGRVSFHTDHLGDFVIARADQSPLYSFVNVLDDAAMEITHVIRGEDLLPTTPNQLLLYRALELKPPQYAHLPLLLGSDRKKLSKRFAATAIEQYREQGYLPEALLNFLALLGWSPPGEEDILTLSELEKLFDLDRVQKAGAVFDPEKLLHLNGAHIRRLDVSELADRLQSFLPEEWYKDKERLERALATVQDRLRLLTKAGDLLGFYFDRPKIPEVPAEQKALVRELTPKLEGADFADESSLEELLHAFLAEHSLGARDLFPALRIILTGQPASPSIPEVMAALGPKETVERLRAVLT
jgi:nondiscriminating glutamyl-tRNA synthetase